MKNHHSPKLWLRNPIPHFSLGSLFPSSCKKTNHHFASETVHLSPFWVSWIKKKATIFGLTLRGVILLWMALSIFGFC
jgi:hypothetical protein